MRLNLALHVRRVECEDILPRENFFESEMPPKLKIAKFNRPDKDLLRQQVNAYCKSVSAKLLSVKPDMTQVCGVTQVSTNDIMSETKSTQQYKQRNSLSAATK